MLKRLFFAAVAVFSLSACSSEPDWVVLAAPQSGDQYLLGERIFHRLADGLGEMDDLVLRAGDSACDARTSERLAGQIVSNEATTRLVIGPLCYSAYKAASPILQQAGIPQLPLIGARNWEDLLEAEATIIARFDKEKIQSSNTIIAYAANQYGNSMAENLLSKIGATASLFPLANLKQTTPNEAVELLRINPAVLIIVGEYPKVRLLVEQLVVRGNNSVLVMTSAAQPALIIQEIGSKRLSTTRFPARVASIELASDPLAGWLDHNLTQLRRLLEEKDEITQQDLNQLPEPPAIKMVRVGRSGELAFDLGL